MKGDGVRAGREQLVRDHVAAVNANDHSAALSTFMQARYEYVASDEVHDGAEEVMAYFESSRRAFPDQRNELLALHHCDDSVCVEAVVRGTHDGPLGGLPPTGRAYELPILAIFLFEGGRLVCERVYFDSNTVLRQLGVARDPLSLAGRLGTVVSHPLTIGRGLIRRVTGR